MTDTSPIRTYDIDFVEKERHLKVSNPFRIACLCILFLAVTSSAHAQSTRMRAPAPSPAASVAGPTPPAGSTCDVDPDSVAPSNLIVTYIGSAQIGLAWTAPGAPPSGCTLDHYKIICTHLRDAGDLDCTPSLPLKFTTTSYNDTGLESQNWYTYSVVAVYIGSDKANVYSSPSQEVSVETVRFTCLLIPLRRSCMNFGSGKDTNINAFWQTNGAFTFLGQVKSIYNGGSGSATISADLGTLNFGNGMQVTVTTNAQAGPSGVTPVSTGTVPTLSSNGAGQATQNMLFGGTFLISQLYPLVAVGASKLNTAGGLGFSADLIAKEGVDVQNFASGTNFNVTSPPFHASGQLTGFLQYNSINLAPNSQTFAGSLFAGGSYGYSYTSPAYLRDYGFASKQNNGIGQIAVGIVINTVARISFSRGFGPSQTYIDSTTMVRTRVNNFKAWSIGVTYQSPTPASKQ
jgi:hypothetical protein